MSAPRDPDLDQLAAGELDDVDDRILSAVAARYSEVDPMPSGLVDRVQFGITLDALHGEIAELERGSMVGVRSDNATEAQTVTFTSSTLSLMITISPTSADEARIDGWVVPGAGAVVDLRLVDGLLSETADADGRFVFHAVRRGFAQFIVRLPGDDTRPPVITPSIEV
ncbi:MAG: carboxypeptidase regulatory-like domain-containing protein [Jatrophihabitans sp.]|uniref:carboxypeptidase regulatory-like domain-containing protein n=1 Tax=Jatrophihabitans sp. TaxID=1932789 RepID=UPI00390F82A7